MFYQMIRRLWPLALLIFLFCLAYYFQWTQYLSFSTLKKHHRELLSWTEQHYTSAVLLFMSCYTLSVAISIPGALILTLTGGLLFGLYLGFIYVVISATLGAVFVFLVVRYALNDWVEQKTSQWIKKMRKGFQNNAFSYLFILRLIPIFPFWVVNIAPALLGVKLRTYFLATLLGILPGSFIYVSVGNSLNLLFKQKREPDLNIIFSPELLLPLLGLALLSLLPAVYKKIQERHG